MSRITIYYASDIHGSEKCWRKFLNAGPFYKADILVMGGDVTGKAIVPIVAQPGGTWACRFLGRTTVAATDDDLSQLESDIRFNGMYPYRCQADELQAIAADSSQQDLLFDTLMERTFATWLQIAEEKLSLSGLPCYVMPGNDDAWVIDRAFGESSRARNCDQKVIDLGEGYSLLSLGYSNPTPWDSPRELPEHLLEERIDRLASEVQDMSRAIFNLHVPPYASELDAAPLLDSDMRPQRRGGQAIMVPVGSTAVRSAIERYQPLLGLHGHIHESKGAKRIGRSLCINPGSNYNSGNIDGVLVVLENGQVKRWQFVTG